MSIPFDSRQSTRRGVRARSLAIVVEKRPDARRERFNVRAQEFEVEDSIRAQSANHGAEKHRATCGEC